MENEIPRCHYDDAELNYDSSAGRDTETMTGESVEYYVCPVCGTQYEGLFGETEVAVCNGV